MPFDSLVRHDDEPDPDAGWRVGRHQPQNLYVDGKYVGVCFDPAWSRYVVDLANSARDAVGPGQEPT